MEKEERKNRTKEKIVYGDYGWGGGGGGGGGGFAHRPSRVEFARIQISALKLAQVNSSTVVLSFEWLVLHTVVWVKDVGSEAMKSVCAPAKCEETRIRNIQPLAPEPAGTYFGGHK